MEDDWSPDRCIAYNRETEVCKLAEASKWLYNKGRPGVGCPFKGSISACNDYSYSKPPFKNHQEAIAWMKFGIGPQQNIPIEELGIEGLTLDGVLMEGATLHLPGGKVKEMQQDGTWWDLPDKPHDS